MAEALLQDLELGNEKGNRLPGETVSVLRVLHKAQGAVMIDRLLNVLVTGQGTCCVSLISDIYRDVFLLIVIRILGSLLL